MRAVCFVKKLQWDLPGTVFRHGLTIGDVDNDGDNELVVGTAEGELYIFKGSELWQKITGLGLVTSVVIGDIFNYGRNALVVVCGDGWVHIYYSPKSVDPSVTTVLSSRHRKWNTLDISYQDFNKTSGNIINIHTTESTADQKDLSGNQYCELSGKMECVHVQRIPTNTKVVLVADVDKDGANEMIIGLTDRVIRSYRWSSNTDLGTGKLVGLNKWECANQIGSVTLQHMADGTPTLLVAQPGGTFMRIKCNAEDCRSEDDSSESKAAASCIDYQTLGISRMRNPNISTEILGDLEPSFLSSNASPENKSKVTNTGRNDPKELNQSDSSIGIDNVDGNIFGGNVVLGEIENTKKDDKISLLPTYNDFVDNMDRNNNDHEAQISAEATEREVSPQHVSEKVKPYALATLDGTIMLVKNEVILWAMQVDHHVSALCRLDVTGDGADEIVACTWDGQTYILDQQKNCVRFQFEESVRAFCTGMYSAFPRSSTPCLVYNNFHNKIVLYYDVTVPSMVISLLNPIQLLNDDQRNALEKLLNLDDNEETRDKKMRAFTEWLLYGMK